MTKFNTPIPVSFFPEGVIFSAQSYMIDRNVPLCEEIKLPKLQRLGDGRPLQVSVADKISNHTKRKTLKRQIKQSLQRLHPKKTHNTYFEGYLVDFRANTPHNWSHMLNDYLPVFFHVLQEMELSEKDATIILPADIPPYIKQLFDYIGLVYRAVDGPVSGQFIEFSVEPWWSVRIRQYEWIKLPLAARLIGDKVARKSTGNIFINRRSGRTISNNDEVVAYLQGEGFTPIYAEDLSVPEQLDTIAAADFIVAVHGAALGPLLYRPDGLPTVKVMEIFPCGHVNRSFQAITADLGGKWVSVRGRIKPEYIRGLYDIGKKFDQFSQDSFEVDIQSMRSAMAYLTSD